MKVIIKHYYILKICKKYNNIFIFIFIFIYIFIYIEILKYYTISLFLTLFDFGKLALDFNSL